MHNQGLWPPLRSTNTGAPAGPGPSWHDAGSGVTMIYFICNWELSQLIGGTHFDHRGIPELSKQLKWQNIFSLPTSVAISGGHNLLKSLYIIDVKMEELLWQPETESGPTENMSPLSVPVLVEERCQSVPGMTKIWAVACCWYQVWTGWYHWYLISVQSVHCSCLVTHASPGSCILE